MNPLVSLILLGSTSGPASLPDLRPPPVVATALVFTPAVAVTAPPVALPRDSRQPVAVVGFDQPTVTHYFLRVDDRQSLDTFSSYGRWDGGSRRAVTVRIGVSTR